MAWALGGGGLTLRVAVLGFPLAARVWGGISWATFRLVEHLTLLHPDDEFHLVFIEDNPNEFGAEQVERLMGERGNLSSVRVGKGNEAARWCEGNVDVVWGPASGILDTKRVAQVFTHHDMRQFSKLRESLVTSLKHKRGLDRAMKNAKVAVMISPTTMRETLERYKGDRYAKKTCFIPWGVPEGFADASEIEPMRPESVVGTEFITTMYDPFPHKRMDLLGKVIPLLEEHGWDLVVMGGMRGKDIDVIFDHPRVHYTGFVSDDLLPRYIKASSLFLHPSEYEGFGHPPYEAMALEVPVLYNARCEALTALVGDRTWTFAGDDDLPGVLDRLMSSEEERTQHVASAAELARSFDWDLTARRYMYTFRMAHEHRDRDVDLLSDDPEPPIDAVTS